MENSCTLDYLNILQECQEIFGDIFTLEYINEMVDGSNGYYGATNLDVENVVFVHGSIDPWHSMGRLTDLNENSPAIVIPGRSILYIVIY